MSNVRDLHLKGSIPVDQDSSAQFSNITDKKLGGFLDNAGIGETYEIWDYKLRKIKGGIILPLSRVSRLYWVLTGEKMNRLCDELEEAGIDFNPQAVICDYYEIKNKYWYCDVVVSRDYSKIKSFFSSYYNIGGQKRRVNGYFVSSWVSLQIKENITNEKMELVITHNMVDRCVDEKDVRKYFISQIETYRCKERHEIRKKLGKKYDVLMAEIAQVLS